MKYAPFYSALVSLILTGCGSSSSSTPEPTPDPEPPLAENAAPQASAGASAPVAGGTVITLDGSSSTDDDDDTLSYEWAVDREGSAYFFSAGGAPSDSLESSTGMLFIPATQAGQDIPVTLTVSDGSAVSTDTVVYSVEACTARAGYLFTDCIDPAWQGPMAWDVNFNNVDENFGYYGGHTDHHVRWALVDAEEEWRGRVFDIAFNKTGWNGSFRIVPSGQISDESAMTDLSAYESGYLMFDLRVVEPTDADIYFEAECGFPCRSVPRQVQTATDGQWTTVSIALTELTDMDWSKASVPFAIYPEWGNQTDVRLQVDNIRFEDGPCEEAAHAIFGDCLGPHWPILAAVDNNTDGEYRSGSTDNHIQWREALSESTARGTILEVNFTSAATDGHFYIRTESRATTNDLSEYLDGALVFDLNVQSYGASTEGLVVRVDTWWDGATSGEIPLPEQPIGAWSKIEIPVTQLLASGGLDITDVHAGFSIWPAGYEAGHQQGVALQLDNIRWEKTLSAP